MPGNVPPNAAPARKVAAHRPTCTHVEMIKVYNTHEICSICRRLPSTGFIYSCDQSNDIFKKVASMPNDVSNGLRKLCVLSESSRDSGSDFDSDLSPSITTAIADGHYTGQQVQVLRQQKQLVRETINDTLFRFQQSIAQGPKTLAGNRKSRAVVNAPSAFHVSDASLRRSLEPCTFKACHACRPLSRDRTFLSFEAVFEDRVQPPDQHDPWTMPVIDASIMKTIGMRASDQDLSSTSKANLSERLSQMTDLHHLPLKPERCPSIIEEAPDEEDEMIRSSAEPAALHERSSNRDFRQSIRNSLQDMLRREMVGINAEEHDNLRDRLQQVCELCVSNDDFEIELWRVMSDKVLADAAGIPLPLDSSNDFDRDFAEHSIFNAAEQPGIEGAVLTEEALETGSPNLIISAA